MPAKGLEQVRRAMAQTFANISGPMAEKTITAVLIHAGSVADTTTPMALGNLVGSRFREVKATAEGWRGRYGYTASYAAAVHAAPGTLKGKNIQRDPRNPGLGDYWDPEGEPQWLEHAFEDELPTLQAIIKKNMSL